MSEQLTDATFDRVISASETPVLVDFWAPWCGPCRGLAPVIDEIAKEYDGRVAIYKMNVDEAPATPSRFGIRAIPTLLVFKNGELVEQVTGAVGKSNITAMLDKALA